MTPQQKLILWRNYAERLYRSRRDPSDEKALEEVRRFERDNREDLEFYWSEWNDAARRVERKAS